MIFSHLSVLAPSCWTWFGSTIDWPHLLWALPAVLVQCLVILQKLLDLHINWSLSFLFFADRTNTKAFRLPISSLVVWLLSTDLWHQQDVVLQSLILCKVLEMFVWGKSQYIISFWHTQTSPSGINNYAMFTKISLFPKFELGWVPAMWLAD